MNRKARRSLKATEFGEYVKALEKENRELRIQNATMRRTWFEEMEKAVKAAVANAPVKQGG